MKILISKSKDVYHNLSLEELLLKDSKFTDDILFIYQNSNACIFGRNQNIHEEINEKYVKENRIKLMRRISGGGAVYQDGGNVCFSFITNNSSGNYQLFLKPIIGFLKSIGLNANFKGKNDLEANGYKISGNAQYKYKNRMFHHGTLLFDADLTILSQALKPNKLKLESKSIKSIRQRVSNIKPLLKSDMNVNQFINKLKEYFIKNNNAQEIMGDTIEKEELDKLIAMRKSHEWIYGKNPEFNVENEKRYPGGTIKFRANIINNIIKDIKFTGDFLSTNNFENIYQLLIDQNYSEDNIIKVLNSIPDFNDYFGKLNKKNILDLMF